MEKLKEYVVFHETKWDDIYDKNGNVVMPRGNNYWLEGFWGLEDCKEWVSEGHQKGSKMGAVTFENVFAVCKEKLVPLDKIEPMPRETIIVCVKTAENLHRWKEVTTMVEAEAFVSGFNNAVETLCCSVFDIEFLD